MEQQARKNFLINTFYLLTVSVLVYGVFRFCLTFLMPFFVGAVVAWLVQKPSMHISKKLKIKTSICAAFTAAVVFAAAISVCAAVFVLLAGRAGGFFSYISDYLLKAVGLFDLLKTKTDNLLVNMPDEFAAAVDSMFKNTLADISTRLAALVSDFTAFTAQKIPAFLISLIVAVVAACYIAADFKALMRFFKNLCGERIFANILRVKAIFTESVLCFAKGYIILMFITFAELSAGLWLLKVRYFYIIAMFTAFIDILPVLGTGTVLIPWAAAELIMHSTPRGVGLIALYAVITVIRNFAEPKIIGTQMGINPLFTLVFMFLGLKLFGMAGMVILPITFIVTVKYYKEEMINEGEAF